MTTECKQCGECCISGGPALHIEDKYLVMQGKIPATSLVTIRPGEIAINQIRNNEQEILEEELIKIRGVGNTWACEFMDANRKCSIYTTRPVECRLLKCWDTRPLLARYNQDRLSRKDLFEDVEGLWDLIEDHEKRCNLMDLREAVSKLEGDSEKEAVTRIGEILSYDRNIRKVMEEKQPKMAEMADLLLGRPIEKLMQPLFELRVKEKDGKLIVEPDRIPTT